MKTILLSFVCALLQASAFSQTPTPAEASKLAQTETNKYLTAFDKADVKALANFYAEDAQYKTDEGALISGRSAIAEGLGKYFAKNQGAKLEASTESARFLTADVLVENGISTVVASSGNRESTRYTVTYVKKGDAWLIAQVEETALPPPDPATLALDGLGWMIGAWKDNSPGITVETRADWTKKNHFIRRSFSVTRDGQNTIEGTEVIGYDPVEKHLRSWVFDSEGGFGEGAWRQEGNKWIVNTKATGPDGSQSTAQHIIAKLDDNKYTWESVNRVRDGEVLPNLDKIEVIRAVSP